MEPTWGEWPLIGEDTPLPPQQEDGGKNGMGKLQSFEEGQWASISSINHRMS